jgi:hypothetical protein
VSVLEQILEGVRADLAARGADAPDDATLPRLVDAHPELFADDGTHMGPKGVSVFVELILASL